MPTEPFTARQVGWDSLLIEVDDPAAWFRSLAKARDEGELTCDDIVPAARTVLLTGIRRVPDLAQLLVESRPSGGRTAVEVPVAWDGLDYTDVAHRWGDDPSTLLKSIEFTVAFCGFAPGFAYLTGLPERCHLPRLDTPRTRVPRGSVAVAGAYAGVYPRSSPGGWRLLGRTPLDLFDLTREPPALLEPGACVRFVDA